MQVYISKQACIKLSIGTIIVCTATYKNVKAKFILRLYYDNGKVASHETYIFYGFCLFK